MRSVLLIVAVVLAWPASSWSNLAAGERCQCQQCVSHERHHLHHCLEAPPRGPIYGSAPAVMAPVMFVPPEANDDGLRLNRALVDQMSQIIQRSLDASKKQQAVDKNNDAAQAPASCNGSKAAASAAPNAPADTTQPGGSQAAHAATVPPVPQLPSTEERLTQIGTRMDTLSLQMKRLESLTVEALETMNARLRQVEQVRPGAQ